MRLIYRDKAMVAHPDKSVDATPSQQAAIRQLNVARELLEKWYKAKGKDLDKFNESAWKHELEKRKGGGKGGGKGKASNLDGRGAKEFTGKKLNTQVLYRSHLLVLKRTSNLIRRLQRKQSYPQALSHERVQVEVQRHLLL